MAAAARPELRNLGDDADAAQLVFLRLWFRIGDPLGLAIDPAVRGHFADGVCEQGSQLTLLVSDTIRRAGFGFGKDRAFGQDQDVPVFATRGALDDPGRFFVLDRERNRHVRQKERLIDDENRQEHVRWFPRGPFLGTTTTGGARLGRGHCSLRAVRGRSPWAPSSATGGDVRSERGDMQQSFQLPVARVTATVGIRVSDRC